MKIFNWVHQKFYQKDRLFSHHGAKKDELIIKGNENVDRKALLENVLFADKDMVNDEAWEGAILAIGTLGFDPMNGNNPDDEQGHYKLGYAEESEDEEEEKYSVEEEKECYDDDDDDGGVPATYDEDEKEELNPLMLGAAVFSTHHDDTTCCSSNDNRSQIIRGSYLSLAVCDPSNSNKKRERITLADLFSADTSSGGQDTVIIRSSASHGGRGDRVATKPAALPMSSQPSKTGLFFVKKLIPKVVGDQGPRRPINKLHQLMTRMLRRKIHPEMEGKKTQTKSSSLTTK